VWPAVLVHVDAGRVWVQVHPLRPARVHDLLRAQPHLPQHREVRKQPLFFVVCVLSIRRTCLSEGSNGGLTSSNPERSSWTTSTFETMGLYRKAYWCMRDEDNPTTWRSFEIYMLILVLCVPTLVMSYTYSKICFQLWMVVRERANLTYRDLGRMVIKMLILVVALFVICWAPILILNVLTAFGGVTTLNYSYLKPLRTTFHLLSYMNSCVNPLVYGFMSKSFRNSFKDALLGCLRPNRSQFVARGTTRLSRTRTTSVSIGRSTYVT
ncbi:unnamed protein product, partial [Ixodes pacificus]